MRRDSSDGRTEIDFQRPDPNEENIFPSPRLGRFLSRLALVLFIGGGTAIVIKEKLVKRFGRQSSDTSSTETVPIQDARFSFPTSEELAKTGFRSVTSNTDVAERVKPQVKAKSKKSTLAKKKALQNQKRVAKKGKLPLKRRMTTAQN